MPEPVLPEAASPTPPLPRFSWPMRIFLFVLVFDIVFRSFSILIPADEWEKELGIADVPVRLDTAAERQAKLQKWDRAGPHPVVEDVMQSLDSVWTFFKPWPEAECRTRLYSWREGGKFVYCWLNTRLGFLENLVGINEEWPMFSPYVSSSKDCTRARLMFADGSSREVHQRRDPEDPTHYSHWFEEKVLNYERLVEDDGADRHKKGYCNLLAHRYPENQAGSPLVSIHLFTVRYFFTPPGADARAFLQAQKGPPPDQVYRDFYHYDVAAGDGKNVNQ